jgi:flagellar hook assembly protein FlgD
MTNAVRHTNQRIPGTISYPNPSERTTTITFSLEKPQDVSIDITDLRGAMIKRVSARCESGPQEISWDGLLDNGESAPNGSYLYRLEADGKQLSGKLTIRR